MSGETLHPDAVALRPVRVLAGELREYEATTFPRNPWGGCERELRRLRAVGALRPDDRVATLDVLNADGDIVQDFPLTARGLRDIRSRWKFRRIHHA